MDYDGRYTKDQSLKCDCLLFGNFSSSSPSFPNKNIADGRYIISNMHLASSRP
jgi:hypothetical protein